MTWCRRVLALSARTAARHWGIVLLLACGTALRIATMMAYWPALVYIDTPRYLGNFALGIDPLGYEFLFTKPLLLLHAGLGAIAVAQHLLGLAMGAALYLLVIRHGRARWLGVLAAAPVLLDSYQLQAEQMIMSDVFFEALICAALVILAWPGSRRRVLTRVLVAAALLGLATTVRQIGELALIPLLAYAVLSRRQPASGPAEPGSRPSKRARGKLALAALGVFAVPVLGYMTLSATAMHDGFQLSNTSNRYLYARLADAADCATLRLPAADRALCPGGPALGIDALANDDTSPFHTATHAQVSQFNHAVLTQQPLRVLGDITGDAVKVFALTKDTSPGDPPLAYWQFQTTYPVFQPAYRMAFGPGSAQPQADPVLAPALRAYQLHGGYTPGPLLLVFGLTAVFGAFDPRSSRRVRATAALGAALALTLVGGADFYEFSWRYQLPLLIVLPPAGVLGAVAVAGTMKRCIRTRLRLNLKSALWLAASSMPIPGSGSARTKSSAPTAPAARMPSSSGTTSR